MVVVVPFEGERGAVAVWGVSWRNFEILSSFSPLFTPVCRLSHIKAHFGSVNHGEKWFSYPIQVLMSMANQDLVPSTRQENPSDDICGFTRERAVENIAIELIYKLILMIFQVPSCPALWLAKGTTHRTQPRLVWISHLVKTIEPTWFFTDAVWTENGAWMAGVKLKGEEIRAAWFQKCQAEFLSSFDSCRYCERHRMMDELFLPYWCATSSSPRQLATKRTPPWDCNYILLDILLSADLLNTLVP